MRWDYLYRYYDLYQEDGGFMRLLSKTNNKVFMTDIAPTIAAMLHIQMPSGSVGNVIEEISK